MGDLKLFGTIDEHCPECPHIKYITNYKNQFKMLTCFSCQPKISLSIHIIHGHLRQILCVHRYFRGEANVGVYPKSTTAPSRSVEDASGRPSWVLDHIKTREYPRLLWGQHVLSCTTVIITTIAKKNSGKNSPGRPPGQVEPIDLRAILQNSGFNLSSAA